MFTQSHHLPKAVPLHMWWWFFFLISQVLENLQKLLLEIRHWLLRTEWVFWTFLSRSRIIAWVSNQVTLASCLTQCQQFLYKELSHKPYQVRITCTCRFTTWWSSRPLYLIDVGLGKYLHWWWKYMDVFVWAVFLLYIWHFSCCSVSIHWLVHGHMTCSNETVYRWMSRVGDITAVAHDLI